MNFAQRSYKPELLDSDNIPFEDIRRNMEELNIINTWLGGHDITIAGVIKLIGMRYAYNPMNEEPVHICEVGCGGGDNLQTIYHWCRKHGIKVKCTGIDIKKECIDYAMERAADMKDAQWICADYANCHFGNDKPDIIFSSLFCHHFTDEQLVNVLQWMQSNAATGFFINDLNRHPLAYFFIKMLTRLFSKSYLVKNDAPLSVLRGFRRKEWKQLLQQAAIKHYTVQWRWAFRHLVVVRNPQPEKA
jgi:2-polyprenyl-3-methyl-5-hydroxy-6-metoxy-1,4-benzoquinol methylase